ncbi:hypothetical protein KFE25_001965 [Diacronema lutheri]|uniref:PSI domain-containing protein n=1 Tax=Diacronema lutheri TaxID=2081491 RepID=A0A8J6CB54_DIALT|nr:hypothetical protein KFE25_001965 [Diacronema lutheri]
MRISAAAAALALSLAAPAAGADAHCSRQIDCHSCTRQNADPGFDSVCAWCFSTGSCSLAYSRASPSLSDWLAGPGLCRDSTTDPGVCKCRPDEYTSCDACTKHVGCVWVNNATSYAIATVTLPFVGERKRTFERRWSNVCWNGNGIAGPTFATAQISGQDLQIVFNSSSSDWAWGQPHAERGRSGMV